jgi:hypothetical protein
MRKVLAIVLAVACMVTFSFSAAFAASPTPTPPGPVDNVTKVINEINALPPADKITINDKAAVEKARADYDALTPEEKQDSRLTPEVMKKLTDAEAALKQAEDKDAADKVSKQIDALPDSPTREEVQKAREAYDALTDDQKAYVPSDTYLKLEKAEQAWNKKDAKARTAKMKSVKMKKGKKAVAKWKAAITGQTGYQIAYSTSKKFTKKTTKYKTVNKAKTFKKTVKKLKAGKKYYFKVRTFTKVYNPEKSTADKKVYDKVYGKWSKAKKTKKVKK